VKGVDAGEGAGKRGTQSGIWAHAHRIIRQHKRIIRRHKRARGGASGQGARGQGAVGVKGGWGEVEQEF
jgi:hypothetical protein